MEAKQFLISEATMSKSYIKTNCTICTVFVMLSLFLYLYLTARTDAQNSSSLPPPPPTPQNDGQQAEVRKQEMKDELNIMKNFREKGKRLATCCDYHEILDIDAARVDEILQLGSSGKNMSEKEAMVKFYKFLAFPLQGVCKYADYVLITK